MKECQPQDKIPKLPSARNDLNQTLADKICVVNKGLTYWRSPLVIQEPLQPNAYVIANEKEAESVVEQNDDTTERTADVPLVLDVDGTLLRTDLLYETFWAALGHDFFTTLWILITCWTSPARLKRRLRNITDPNVDLLPVRAAILDLAHEAIARGRPVHLVSGSDQGLVDAVAHRFSLPGEHFGSDGTHNLTDGTKAGFLTDRFGERGYDYAGNSWADCKSWKNARQVIAVSPGARLSAWLTKLAQPMQILKDEWPPGVLLKEMRPHQWVKNLLLFLPLLAAQEFQPATILQVLIAILAFSIGASAIYIVNDLLDLEADRQHPEKRNRPIASGALPIRAAMAASTLLGIAALGLASLVSPGVAALTLTYMISSLVYSLWLKKLRWIDVITLACLFLLRVLTGAEASQIDVPGWLLAFVFAVFFTLACVKRVTGLTRVIKVGRLPGRGYTKSDLINLEKASYLGVILAALFFVGYAFSFAASEQFSSPILLALSVFPITFWLIRVVRLSELGEEDYDPIMFVAHDKFGLVLAVIGVAIALLAV